MKSFKPLLIGLIVLVGLPWALAGCVAEVGGGGPWYHDGPWMDGGWGHGPRGGIDIHPGGFRR
jgi:hypothetical protein